MDLEDLAEELKEQRKDIKEILRHVTSAKVDKAIMQGEINALNIVQGKMCSEFEQVKIDIEPAMFFKKYPGIAKAAIIGIIVVMLGTIYSTYNILFTIGDNKYKVERKNDSNSNRS